MTVEAILATIGATLLPIVGWVFRVERAIYDNNNAVSAASIKSDTLKELIESKFNAQEKTFATFDINVDRRLARIEATLNGYLKDLPHD